MTTSGDKTPLDQLIELMVYAPVGLIYERDEVLDRLVTRGRSQVQLARLMAKMASQRKGGPEAMVGDVIAQAADVVAKGITDFGIMFGLAPDRRSRPGSSGPAPSGSTRVDPPAVSSPVVEDPVGAEAVTEEPLADERVAMKTSVARTPARKTAASGNVSRKPTAAKSGERRADKRKATATLAPVATAARGRSMPAATGSDADADAETLPIAGYDTLTARDVIALVDDLDVDQRRRVSRYEAANRNRKTVLAKLDRAGT